MALRPTIGETATQSALPDSAGSTTSKDKLGYHYFDHKKEWQILVHDEHAGVKTRAVKATTSVASLEQDKVSTSPTSSTLGR